MSGYMEPVLTTTQLQNHHLLLASLAMVATSLGSSCHEMCLPPEDVIKDKIKTKDNLEMKNFINPMHFF